VDEDVLKLQKVLGVEALSSNSDGDDEVNISVAMGIMRGGDDPITAFERSMTTTSRTCPNKNARVNRNVKEKRILKLLEINPQLAFVKIDFFHEQAPPLLHLCLFHKASLFLIQKFYELNPDALHTTLLFGWLTPLHAAAMRLNGSDELLRFLLPRFEHAHVNLLNVPILPFVLRRVDCFETFLFCLDHVDPTMVLDYAGNSILHIACNVGDEYATIFESFGYKGSRLDVAAYLMQTYPQLVSRQNKQHHLPLHSLLSALRPPTELALQLIAAYPPTQTMDALQLACSNGAQGAVVQTLYPLVPLHLRNRPLRLAFGTCLGSASGGHEASESAIHFLLSQYAADSDGVLELTNIPNLDFYNARAVATFIAKHYKFHTVRVVDSFLCPMATVALYGAIFENPFIVTMEMPHATDFMEDMLKQVMLGTRPVLNDALVVADEFPSLPEFVDLLYDWLLQNDHVTHLDLSCNRVPEPEVWLSAFLDNPDTLESLNLAGTSLKNAGPVLVDIVQSNKNLKNLQLECTCLPEADVIDILEILPKNRTLQSISLDPDSQKVMEVALQVVKANNHIVKLDFPYFCHRECRDLECSCNVLRPYWRQIQHACAVNRVIRQHVLCKSNNNKERFVCNVVLPSAYSVSMLYDVLRLEPDLWSMLV
jgi:hypothetical protein